MRVTSSTTVEISFRDVPTISYCPHFKSGSCHYARYIYTCRSRAVCKNMGMEIKSSCHVFKCLPRSLLSPLLPISPHLPQVNSNSPHYKNGCMHYASLNCICSTIVPDATIRMRAFFQLLFTIPISYFSESLWNMHKIHFICNYVTWSWR